MINLNKRKKPRIAKQSSLRGKVFVALSGGVDSSVAALLLKQQGYEVTGVHMICADSASLKSYRGIEHPDEQNDIGIGICEQAQNDRRDALRVALKLGVPFLTFDFRKEYREKVFEYMIKEYAAGRTPNPDVMCNNRIKFGVFLKRAVQEGADYIATGHYVRLATSHSGLGSRKCRVKRIALNPIGYTLVAARDAGKDQSYFLWTLKQEQLKHCLFPIGDYLKSEVREMARKFGYAIAEKKDSQGLCFVGKVDFRDFLKGVIPPKKGKVLDIDGKEVGRHDGTSFYTIGQRHGIGIGGTPEPYYVADKNPAANTLVVVPEKSSALYKKEIGLCDINFINSEVASLIRANGRIDALARVRYRQPLQKATLFEITKPKSQIINLTVIFNEPQRAVASGQSAVFYRDDEMLGGGVII